MGLYDHSHRQDKQLRHGRRRTKRIALFARLNTLPSGTVLVEKPRREVDDGWVAAMQTLNSLFERGTFGRLPLGC